MSPASPSDDLATDLDHERRDEAVAHPDATAVAPAGAPLPVVSGEGVTAVLVAHDGQEWLPRALAALAASDPAPEHVVLVDTGSTDDTPALLAATGHRVVTLDRTVGFGAAVAAALAQVPATSWVWLLHDDVAVTPDTLRALLTEAATSPSAGLLGPKGLDWVDPRVLVEIGVSVDPGGHRETFLERREYDQGQYDDVRDVLAVGTAGALVRRDVWDEVGGLDPALAVFRDDLDLGWKVNAAGHRVLVVPGAVVHHARAATTGRRALDAEPGLPAGVDRRNALYVLLAHTPGPRLVLTVPRLVVWGLLRALGFLLTRQVWAARDEVAALAHLARHAGELSAARAARAAQRRHSPAQVRPLLAPRTARVRARAAELADRLSGGAAPDGPGASALEPVHDGADDDFAELAPAGPGVLRELLARRPVQLVGVLLVVALLAQRSLLALGGGDLVGGRLLPVPSGARDLWAAYAASWHPSVVGSDAPAPAYLGVLALLATVLLGKAWLAVDVVLLGSVPLAALTAWYAAGRVVRNQLVRLWGAVTWAVLPVATGAVATGRLDVAATQVLLPLLVLLAHRALVTDAAGSDRWAWVLGLVLAVAAAFAPLVWLLAVPALVLVVLLAPRRRVGALVRALVVAPLLLMPWTLALVQAPSRIVHGPGRVADDAALLDLDPDVLSLLLLQPGGAGTPARWVAAGLVLAALAALLRGSRQRMTVGAWALAGGGYVAAVLLTSVRPADVAVSPAVPLQVAGLGLLGAALVGADGLRTRLRNRRFGPATLAALAVVVVATLAPVSAAAGWVARGADGPLQRGSDAVLPAFAAAEADAEPGLRALVLTPRADGPRYALVPATGTRLGAADTPPEDRQVQLLDAVVADLLAPSGSDAAEALATRAVRYVALLPGPRQADLALVLDRQAGLTRRTSDRVLLWQVVAPAGRLTLLPPASAEAARGGDLPARGPSRDLVRSAPAQVLPAGREAARVPLAAGPEGRLLVLAEARSDGWRARVDGTALQPVTAWGWAQAWEVPADGGTVEVSRSTAARRGWLAWQVLVLVVVGVLAAPDPRRRRGLEDSFDDLDPAVPAVPAPSAPSAPSARAEVPA